MRDQFDREITYIRVSVTDRCNLRCVYCMPEEGIPCVSHRDILTFDEIVRICRAGAELGISRIKLTGGEPLVRKGLPDLVGMLKAIPGIEQVTLTTNGILLREQINELVSNGLDAVNISIDTLDAERYHRITRLGRLEDALAGLNAACSCPQLAVRVNCVPLRQAAECEGEGYLPEEEEYIRMALLAQDRKIDVRFIEMMPIGMGREFAGRTGEEIQAILERRFGKAGRVKGSVGNGPASYIQFEGMRGRIGFISAVTHKFCGSCNRIRLTSEGMIKPCLQYDTGVDLRKILRAEEQTDEQLREALQRAVFRKPSGHRFEAPGTGEGRDNEGNETAAMPLETREMSQIGG